MPGNFKHSVAAIIQHLVIAKGLGTLPSIGGEWPVYAGNEADRPDNCITVYSTQGIDHGRRMDNGQRQEHYGFQVRVRFVEDEEGNEKVSAICDVFDKEVYAIHVTIDTRTYCVHSINRRGQPIDGKYETPTSRRLLKFINCISHIVQITP